MSIAEGDEDFHLGENLKIVWKLSIAEGDEYFQFGKCICEDRLKNVD